MSDTCDRCGSPDLQRLISKVAILRPAFDASKLDKRELLNGVDFQNPASMAQFFRKMGDTFQDEQGPPGPRSFTPTAYAAYVRDPDGNKLCAYTFVPG